MDKKEFYLIILLLVMYLLCFFSLWAKKQSILEALKCLYGIQPDNAENDKSDELERKIFKYCVIPFLFTSILVKVTNGQFGLATNVVSDFYFYLVHEIFSSVIFNFLGIPAVIILILSLCYLLTKRFLSSNFKNWILSIVNWILSIVKYSILLLLFFLPVFSLGALLISYGGMESSDIYIPIYYVASIVIQNIVSDILKLLSTHMKFQIPVSIFHILNILSIATIAMLLFIHIDIKSDVGGRYYFFNENSKSFNTMSKKTVLDIDSYGKGEDFVINFDSSYGTSDYFVISKNANIYTPVKKLKNDTENYLVEIKNGLPRGTGLTLKFDKNIVSFYRNDKKIMSFVKDGTKTYISSWLDKATVRTDNTGSDIFLEENANSEKKTDVTTCSSGRTVPEFPKLSTNANRK